MREELILQLTEEELELLAPEMVAVAQAEQLLRELKGRLTRMLMLRCPEYLREEGVEFDLQRGAFVRLVPTEAPSGLAQSATTTTNDDE